MISQMVILLLALSTSLCYSSDKFDGNTKISELKVDLKTFRRQNLDCHDKYRKIHGVLPLTSSAELDEVAQKHATFLAYKDTMSNNSNNSTYGRNLEITEGQDVDGTTACTDWYSEEKLYDYSKDNPENFHDVGHFTQVVSRESCFMGIGLAKSKSGRIYIVAMYDPPGNIEGMFRKNVFPPGHSYGNKLNPFESLIMTPVCGDAEKEEYMEQNLKCHNTLRKMHGVQPLIYSDELNKCAENLANELAFGKTMIGRKGMDCISYQTYTMISSGNRIKTNGHRFCQVWYEKARFIDIEYFHSLDTSQNIRNAVPTFTQMIWNSTLYMGFAIGLGNNGSVYTVVVYDPPGNIRGQYRNNIYPKQFNTSSSTNHLLVSHKHLYLYLIFFFLYLGII